MNNDTPTMNKAERKALHRRLSESGKTQTEIAVETGYSQATVARDLAPDLPAELAGASKEAIERATKPIGTTPGGARFYAPDRFGLLPAYQARVAGLKRDMPERNAKLLASREFAARLA